MQVQSLNAAAFQNKFDTVCQVSSVKYIQVQSFNAAAFQNNFDAVKLLLALKTCHEIMVLFVLRKLILQTSMLSNPVGLDVGPFYSSSYVCEQRRLRPGPSLVTYVAQL